MSELVSKTEMISEADFPGFYRRTVAEIYDLVHDKTPEVERRAAYLSNISDEDLLRAYRALPSVSKWGLQREVAKDLALYIARSQGQL